MYALIEGYAIAPYLITECVQGIYDSEESVPIDFKENPRNSIDDISTFDEASVYYGLCNCINKNCNILFSYYYYLSFYG